MSNKLRRATISYLRLQRDFLAWFPRANKAVQEAEKTAKAWIYIFGLAVVCIGGAYTIISQKSFTAPPSEPKKIAQHVFKRTIECKDNAPCDVFASVRAPKHYVFELEVQLERSGGMLCGISHEDTVKIDGQHYPRLLRLSASNSPIGSCTMIVRAVLATSLK